MLPGVNLKASKKRVDNTNADRGEGEGKGGVEASAVEEEGAGRSSTKPSTSATTDKDPLSSLQAAIAIANVGSVSRKPSKVNAAPSSSASRDGIVARVVSCLQRSPPGAAQCSARQWVELYCGGGERVDLGDLGEHWEHGEAANVRKPDAGDSCGGL